MPEREAHYVHRAGWLRAAVLGANDGLISTASLIVGVASAGGLKAQVLTAALAGVAAGAMSMAAGEYVSVSSQADSERADLAREAAALRQEPARETAELTGIYQRRGLPHRLARKVARSLMQGDALSAHARDELGFTEESRPAPLMAAFASAVSFALGAVLPTAVAALAPSQGLVATVAVGTVALLAGLGALGGWLGGAHPLRPALRVALWGAIALGVTAGLGLLIGAAV